MSNAEQPKAPEVSPSEPAAELSARRAFLVLVVVAIIGVLWVIWPFAQAFFFAAVLAGALHPLVTRITRKLKRRSVSALLVIFATVMLLLGPIAALVAFIVGEAVAAVKTITEVIQREGTGGLLERVPGTLRRPVDWILERIPDAEQLVGNLNDQLSGSGGKAAAAVTGVLSTTGTLVVQGVLMLIALYFFLVDGARLLRWLSDISPLKAGQTEELLTEFRKTSVAVIVSTVATSGVQAIAALIGYLIARLPYPVFFAALTFFVAFIPAVGAGSVCVAAALLLLATGHTGFAIFLAIWGVVVVGLSDNVVKPILVKRGMDLHGAVVFFALLGGIAAFGAAGLIVGPLTVAFFLATVRIWHRDFGKGAAAAETVEDATTPPGPEDLPGAPRRADRSLRHARVSPPVGDVRNSPRFHHRAVEYARTSRW